MLPKDITANKMDKNPCPHPPYILLGETDNKQGIPKKQNKTKNPIQTKAKRYVKHVE